MSIIVSLKSSSLNMNVLLAALLVATAGGILQIGGASWDVTSHILRQPETFFTPSHTILYTGAGLTTIAAIIGIFISLRNKEEISSRSFYTAFKLLIIGAAIQLVSGPGDFVWHSVFGVDGLMSPPHLALATGILINAIAAVIGLARILPHMQSKKNQTLVRTALIPAFAALWFSSIWYIFMFVLPLSNGEHFNFNPDPAAAVLIATIALPFVSAMIFLISARTIGRLGAASTVAGVVISMNVLANIAPAYQSLGAFLPWQLLAIIPVIIGADIAIHRAGPQTGMIVAGALIGITFYIFNFPMLPMTFAELLNQPNLSIDDILPSMYASLSQVIIMTAAPSVLFGIVGTLVGSKKIQMPEIDVAISR
jgi:type III secretory pathway component EscS